MALSADSYLKLAYSGNRMETVVVKKEAFTKILNDMEILIQDVELALDAKVQKRLDDIKSGKDKGKTEKEYYDYLSKRGVAVGKVRR